MIISLLSQKIKLQVWNSRSKISSRAWANRFASFRLANVQAEGATECGEYQIIVIFLMRFIAFVINQMFFQRESGKLLFSQLL